MDSLPGPLINDGHNYIQQADIPKKVQIQI